MSARALPHGLHRDVPESVYHVREPGIASKSALDELSRSPAHYKAWLDGAEQDETPALFFGKAFHCAVLEPSRFGDTYAIEPVFGDCRFKEPKARRVAWRKDNGGKIPISAAEAMAIRGMLASINAHPMAGRMLLEGEPELTVRWKDAASGIECKSRADYYVSGLSMVVDVKTALDASAEAFRRVIYQRRYHVQDAMYRAGFAAAGSAIEHFVFLAVEKEPPYAVALYTLDHEGVEAGYKAAAADLQRLAGCLSSDSFPGYPTEIQTVTLPPWAA